MSIIVKVRCPICKKRTNAERKSKYLHKMGCLMAIVHFLLILMTGSLWVGWMIGRGYFAGKTNFCLKCSEEVDNERII